MSYECLVVSAMREFKEVADEYAIMQGDRGRDDAKETELDDDMWTRMGESKPKNDNQKDRQWPMDRTNDPCARNPEAFWYALWRRNDILDTTGVY